MGWWASWIRFPLASVNSLSANPTTWSNTLKEFVGKLPTNCLSVLDHFVKLALRGLSWGLEIEGTLLQHLKIYKYLCLHKKNMPKFSHYRSIYFLSYAHTRYTICLFTNIQKQHNMLRSSPLFHKNSNFTSKKPRELLGLRMGNFQGIVFMRIRIYSEIFKACISVPLKPQFHSAKLLQLRGGYKFVGFPSALLQSGLK